VTIPHSLELWDNAARLALPVFLKGWLFFLAATFLASLAFVRRHPPARWAIAGFAASHLVLVVIGAAELATIRTGLVSLAHSVCWAPVLVVLILALPGTPPRSAYGIWCRMLIAIIAIALVFDVRDAAMYLYYQWAGHPALG
jgi:hypothetical protein